MSRTARKLMRIGVAVVAGAGCLCISENFSITAPQSIVSTANAVVGRPLTPMSYAGVARRTTRRAVTAPAVVAPAPAGRCVQSVDAYGRVIRRCY
jgi:hypothetical protein